MSITYRSSFPRLLPRRWVGAVLTQPRNEMASHVSFVGIFASCSKIPGPSSGEMDPECGQDRLKVRRRKRGEEGPYPGWKEGVCACVVFHIASRHILNPEEEVRTASIKGGWARPWRQCIIASGGYVYQPPRSILSSPIYLATFIRHAEYDHLLSLARGNDVCFKAANFSVYNSAAELPKSSSFHVHVHRLCECAK